ncbi:MAG: hypothetical protein QXG27_06140 [Candidatus Bathyarchaeia archaeon]
MTCDILEKLDAHRQKLEVHFEKASKFLVKCQIIEPYVEKGTLHGCICPWEIGESTDEGVFPVVEDFHDTLEAIWVWSYYTKISRKQTFKPHIEWAWEYVTKNWKRFIKEEKTNGSLYDCSFVLFGGTFYQKVFSDNKYEKLVVSAGNHLEKYLGKLESTKGREYYDPFWMTFCLGLAAKQLKQEKWFRTAETFVKNNIVLAKRPFSSVEREPRHKGPGNHDFFCKNANKALALMVCLDQEEVIREILLKKFLPCLPKNFVLRHVDENAWNAHLASAIGKSYILTSNIEFLKRYFAIIDELKARDVQKSAALPRSPSFLRRESWVAFFYAYAYASVCHS